MQCRTAALGGHVQACPDGHIARIWYNSCRHRACPQCAYLQTERWLALQQARLLACDHYHVIFTLPHDLNPLWLANVSVMTTLLFQAVHDTLRTLLADPKYLGAQPGIIAALHTWSQTLMLHPHVHCLVTGGGRTSDGAWKAVRDGFLLPARVIMAVFRGKLLAAMRQRLCPGALVLPEAMRPQQFLNLLNRLGHARKTRGMCTFGSATATERVWSRILLATCGAARSKTPGWWPGTVTAHLHLSCAAGGGRRGPASPHVTLSVADFLQRWLLHVPVPQTRVVRSYGLYHPTQAEALTVCRTRLATAGGGARAAGPGRRCVRSRGEPIRSAVLPVGSGSCAPA